ncbi:AraC family transcriptional regulator [Methylobacterium sp. NEAU 140]|uniref:AraC family transcriptional regulator n=1 Tax=Methylobacterium sp. NEAU 140 TaxID=3064945 RepID=UPI002736D19F|nr:AraC family transcriptional regulator [Methylobacterium sp. NEAU 140]MDP4023406.1 AraC family transcriptional regulator [Methylobacterium sp. NEAU 140]
MPTWSTDHLPPPDRFEYWREVIARRLLGVEAEIEVKRRPTFIGRARASAVGPACLIEAAVSAHTMRVTRCAIERQAAEGGVYLWHLVSGGGAVTLAGGAERIAGDTLVTGCGDIPAAYRPDLTLFRPSGCSGHRVVLVPRRVFSTLLVPSRMSARQHRCAAGLDALLRGYLATFMEQASNLSGPAAEDALRTLVQLIAAARGASDIREDAAATAIRQALLVRAQDLIERELHRADLNPARVAARLGISVRKLHLVFEPSGETFGRHLLARRLALADRLLRDAPHLSVTEVAYAAGFESLSTFFRGYRAAYGASPGERRRTASA